MRLLRLLTTCLVGVLAGCSTAVTDTSTSSTAPPTLMSTPYSLLQINLCLSGLASCLEYPIRPPKRLLRSSARCQGWCDGSPAAT
jgi:hypothetical protein